MDLYRGDNRGPGDMDLRTIGFKAKPPALPMNGAQARDFLADIFKTKTSFDIGVLWRASTPGFLIATALTQTGAFQGMKYFYKIIIPDNELTLQAIDIKGRLQHTFPVGDALDARKYFLLFNNRRYQDADMIAFCHGIVSTKEVTFLTTIPARYIYGYRSGMSTHIEKLPFAPFIGPHRPRIYAR
jgi:hypothetical protein